jgi:hypothetical protein
MIEDALTYRDGMVTTSALHTAGGCGPPNRRVERTGSLSRKDTTRTSA